MKRSKRKARAWNLPWLLPWLSGRPRVAPRRDALDEYIETEKIKFLPWNLPWLLDDESDPAWMARRDDEYIETETDREWGARLRKGGGPAQRASAAARNKHPLKARILAAFDEIHKIHPKLSRRAIAKRLAKKFHPDSDAIKSLLLADPGAKKGLLQTNEDAIESLLRRNNR